IDRLASLFERAVAQVFAALRRFFDGGIEIFAGLLRVVLAARGQAQHRGRRNRRGDSLTHNCLHIAPPSAGRHTQTPEGADGSCLGTLELRERKAIRRANEGTMSAELTEDQQLIVETARAFAQEKLRPNAARWEDE